MGVQQQLLIVFVRRSCRVWRWLIVFLLERLLIGQTSFMRYTHVLMWKLTRVICWSLYDSSRLWLPVFNVCADLYAHFHFELMRVCIIPLEVLK